MPAKHKQPKPHPMEVAVGKFQDLIRQCHDTLNKSGCLPVDERQLGKSIHDRITELVQVARQAVSEQDAAKRALENERRGNSVLRAELNAGPSETLPTAIRRVAHEARELRVQLEKSKYLGLTDVAHELEMLKRDWSHMCDLFVRQHMETLRLKEEIVGLQQVNRELAMQAEPPADEEEQPITAEKL